MIEQPTKAYLEKISDSGQGEAPDGGGKSENRLTVHFNPESLKVAYANQNSGGEQRNGATAQSVGNLTAKLTVELLFDTTEEGTDVRQVTEWLLGLLGPIDSQSAQPAQNSAPPRTRFHWGNFIFEGVVESLNETLDYFSADGMPLRATIALNMKSDNAAFIRGKLQAGPAGQGGPGVGAGNGATSPLSQARPGDSVQSLAGRLGRSSAWKEIAAANGIDDPLRPDPGSLLNLNMRG